jgi:hypothetical protein
MDDFLTHMIEEAFTSKKQQNYFYAKANDKTLSKKERLKWQKMASEFSEKTNFKKLPKTAEKELDEVVDEDGNIITNKKPADFKVKGITSNSTTDDAVGMSHGQMGSFGIGGPINTSRTLKYWAESDMSKTLGFKDTIGSDANYDDAIDHLENELGLPDDEAEERAEKMGYDDELPDGKIRLIENPKEYIEEYIDNILNKKNKINDIVTKSQEIDETTFNPIILRQIKSLKQSLINNDININDVINYLKHE